MSFNDLKERSFRKSYIKMFDEDPMMAREVFNYLLIEKDDISGPIIADTFSDLLLDRVNGIGQMLSGNDKANIAFDKMTDLAVSWLKSDDYLSFCSKNNIVPYHISNKDDQDKSNQYPMALFGFCHSNTTKGIMDNVRMFPKTDCKIVFTESAAYISEPLFKDIRTVIDTTKKSIIGEAMGIYRSSPKYAESEIPTSLEHILNDFPNLNIYGDQFFNDNIADLCFGVDKRMNLIFGIASTSSSSEKLRVKRTTLNGISMNVISGKSYEQFMDSFQNKNDAPKGEYLVQRNEEVFIYMCIPVESGTSHLYIK